MLFFIYMLADGLSSSSTSYMNLQQVLILVCEFCDGNLWLSALKLDSG